MPEFTQDQVNVIKEVLEICESIPYNTDRVYKTSAISADGEHVTHIDREQWLESLFEYVGDRIGQEFDVAHLEREGG